MLELEISPGISGISIMLPVNHDGRETLHHKYKLIFYGKYNLALEIEVDANAFSCSLPMISGACINVKNTKIRDRRQYRNVRS